MKKSTLLSFFIALTSLVYSQTGMYFPYGVQTHTSEEIKRPDDLLIQISDDDIKIVAYERTQFTYRITSKEREPENSSVVYRVVNSRGVRSKFTVIDRGSELVIWYSEDAGYIYYFCVTAERILNKNYY